MKINFSKIKLNEFIFNLIKKGKFFPLYIYIKMSLPKEINLANEPEFVRQLSTLIAQQARINSSGGKLSPNMY